MKRSLVISKPIYLILLNLFFVFHGFVENFDLVPVKDAIFILGIYLIIQLAVLLLSFFLFRNLNKAALFAFLIMAVNFFLDMFMIS